MPHTTTWEEHGVWWQFYGTVTPQELAESDAEMYGDPRFEHIKYFIWDTTDVEDITFSEVHVELSAASDWAAASYKQHMKGALVANNKHVQKRIQRYIETSIEFESTWDLKLFENLEAARLWLSS